MPTTVLTQHFTWAEVIYSGTAKALGIDNTPSAAERDVIEKCTGPFMEQARALLGHPILVSSWYRGPELNRVVGGAASSEHCAGRAVDFTCPGFGSVYQCCLAIRDSSLAFNQLIYERLGGGAWVHLSCPAPGQTAKREVLTIDSYGTYPGLV